MTQCGLAASAPRTTTAIALSLAGPTQALSCCATMRAMRCRPEYGTLGLPPEQLAAPHRLRHRRRQRDACAGRGAGRAGRHDPLLAAADRPQPGRGRPHPHHAALRRRHRPGQPPSRRGRARAPRPPLLRALPSRHRGRHRQLPCHRRHAAAAVDPLLHRELEGPPRPWHVGVLWDGDRAAGAGRCSRRSMPRATSSSATTSLIRASSRATACGSTPPARARQRHHRGPPGPDPRRTRARRRGPPASAALSRAFCAYIEPEKLPRRSDGIAASALRPERHKPPEAAPRRRLPRRCEGRWGHDQDRQARW